MKRVLVIMADGFEEIEAITPVDVLRRAGVDVVTASLAENRHVTGRCGVTAHTDAALSQVATANYDMVLLPGGPGVKALRADARVGEIIRRHLDAGAWLAAICAAPTVLHDCGILQGRRYTAHFSVAGELPDILGDETVVTDGKVVTSRGAGTALEFGLHLVELLTTKAKAAEISKAICV
jgi:protein deglycase